MHISAPHIKHSVIPELSATLYRHRPPPSPLVVATAALKAWVTSLKRRGVGSFFMATFQSSIILSVTLTVSTAFLDFFKAFWLSSSASSLSLLLASYMRNRLVWKFVSTKRTHQLTPVAGLPPVQMAICGTFSHPRPQSCLCRQSLEAFGRSVAEIWRTPDLCSLTWTAAPCAQRPYPSSLHHYKEKAQ